MRSGFGLGLGLRLGAARGALGGGGAPPLPAFSDYGFEYYDDFETARVLHGTNSFEVITAGQTNNMLSDNGYAHLRNLYQADTQILFGPLAGFPENIHFRWGYNAGVNAPETDAFNANLFNAYVWWVDANNHLALNVSLSLSRISLTIRIGGVNTSLYFKNVPLTTTGVIDIYIIAGKLYAMLDGKWVPDANVLTYPFDAQDVSTVSAPNRVGRVGFRGQAYRWPLMYEIGATPVYVTLDDHTNFFPRDSRTATKVSARALTGTYATKTPAQLVYRLRTSGTQTVVQDWREMGSPSFGGGVWSGTISAPVGGPYMADVGYIDTNGKYHFIPSKSFCVGALYAYDGQSNALGRGNGQTITKTDTAFTGALTVTPNGFVSSNFNTLATVAALAGAKSAAAAMGVPVCIVPIGVSGAALEALIPTGGNWSRVTDLLSKYGKPEGVIWDQGEGNADNTASVLATYASLFISDLLAGWRSATGDASLPFLLVHPGRYASATAPNAGNAATIDDRRRQLAQQFEAIAASDPLCKLGPAHLGQEHSDAYHYTGQGYARACERDGYSIAKVFGGIATADGRGPICTGATLNGGRDVITLTFDLNGATTLTDIVNLATGTVPTPTLAGGLYGYQVSIDDFATLRTISSIVRSGTNQLVITLSAAAPAGTVKVRSMYGWSYDDTNLFYGNGYADGRANIPADPIRTPLVAA